jgi:hypothetical protein
MRVSDPGRKESDTAFLARTTLASGAAKKKLQELSAP